MLTLDKGMITSQAGQAGKREISPHYLQWHAIQNLLIVYFWNFPFSICGPLLTTVKETMESKTTAKDTLLYTHTHTHIFTRQ